MTIAYWCVLAAAALTYLATGLAKAGGRMPPNANHTPREWLEQLQGWPKRAHWAQQNGFEAFPLFAAAVIIAGLAHAPQARIDSVALAFIGCRVAYLILYLADLSWLRTVAWICGVACCVWLFFLGA
ncbi:MAG TPA: MAPEG family protein [Nevskia sp.]|jgi:uncharacterized MAPEG superfamily protein|nr:MAPEG family protein [Nevskia sp.]